MAQEDNDMSHRIFTEEPRLGMVLGSFRVSNGKLHSQHLDSRNTGRMIEGKLGFSTTAGLWLASDLRYVPRTLQVQQFGDLHCCHV